MQKYIDQTRQVQASRVTIGSHPQQSDITMDLDRKLEPIHGEFVKNTSDNKWYFRNLSQRGSFLRIQSQDKMFELSEGSIIKFGDEKVFQVKIGPLK
jgi:hypothetical protein